MSGEVVVFPPKNARPDLDFLRAPAHLLAALNTFTLRVLYV